MMEAPDPPAAHVLLDALVAVDVSDSAVDLALERLGEIGAVTLDVQVKGGVPTASVDIRGLLVGALCLVAALVQELSDVKGQDRESVIADARLRLATGIGQEDQT